MRCNYQAGSAALRLTAKTNSGQITGTGLLCSGLLACCLQLGTTSADKLAGVASWTKKLDSVGRSLLEPKETTLVLKSRSYGSKMIALFHMLFYCYHYTSSSLYTQGNDKAVTGH